MNPMNHLTRIAHLCAASAALLAGGSALAGDAACGTANHDCYTSGDPGCNNPECCATVCGEDPYCCNVAWDASCVNRAFALCGLPPCTVTCPEGALSEGEPCGESTNGGCNLTIVGDSICCDPHLGLGCDNLDCQTAVCGFEIFCCELQWDNYCVQLALDLCDGVCSLSTPQFTPLACGQTICGTSWADDFVQDSDWYEVVITETTKVTFTVTSSLPMRYGIVNNDGVPDCGLGQQLSPVAFTDFCGSSSITTCLVPGTYWFVANPAVFDNFPCGSGYNDYFVSMSCDGTCIPPACGVEGTTDCFEPGNGPYCADAECCQTVCNIDPYCCDVVWDGACVGSAQIHCVSCALKSVPGEVLEAESCGGNSNDGCNFPIVGESACCDINPTPGCDDPTCQDAVCSINPYCCEVQWDAFCAGYTPFVCPELCAFGLPQFEPISCGMTVRGTAWSNNSFKDTDWYELTLTERTNITVTGVAQFPLVIGLSDTGGTGGCLPGTGANQLNPYVLAYPCEETSFTTCVEPGTWYVYVAPQGGMEWPCEDTLSCNCPDQNGDGSVNGADLGILLSAWGTNDPCADLDGGGVVDGADLGSLLAAWGPYTCPTVGRNGYSITLGCGGVCEGLANDTCDTAQEVSLGDYSFTTVGATSGGPVLPLTCDEGLGITFVRDVWFKYTATETNVLTVYTCDQAGFDTRLAAYDGSCGTLNLVGCNDDNAQCSFFWTSRMDFVVEEGVTYYIRVGSFGDSGAGTITLSF